MYRKCSKKARPSQKTGNLSFFFQTSKKRIVAHAENLLEGNELFDVDVANTTLHNRINATADIETSQLKLCRSLLLRKTSSFAKVTNIITKFLVETTSLHSHASSSLAMNL